MGKDSIEIPVGTARVALKILDWAGFELKQQNQGGNEDVVQLVADVEIAIAIIKRRLET